jgi:hypothetical protein
MIEHQIISLDQPSAQGKYLQLFWLQKLLKQAILNELCCVLTVFSQGVGTGCEIVARYPLLFSGRI